MTNFNPKGGFKNITLWESIAEKKAGNTGAASRIITGILLGGLGVSMGAEILGGVVAAWLLKSAWEALDRAGKRLKLVRDMGCNAFVLDEHDFRTYVQQFGDETVYQELIHAEAQGCELSNFSANWLRTHSKNLNPVPEVQETKTVLEVVMAPFTSIKDRDQATKLQNQTQSQVNIYNPTNTIDILGELTNTITNAAFVAVPRSGKGMLISNAIREAKRKHPKLKIFVIDPKNDTKEYSFYEGIADKIERRSCIDASPSSVVEWAKYCFNKYVEFANQHEKTLLIVEDGTLIGGKLNIANSNLFIDKISSWTSGADSFGRNVWFVLQTPFVGASALNLSSSSQLKIIVIAWVENLGALTQWRSAKMLNKLSLDEVTELVEISPCNRAFYFGKTGKWYPMPRLENYSGYDRDTETYLPGFAPQLDRTTTDLDTVNQLENNFNSEPEKEDSHQTEVDNSLSEPAKTVLDWLLKNRLKQWVKYKGGDRDQTFVNFLVKVGFGSQDKMVNELFAELLVLEKIDIDEKEGTIIAL